MAKGIISFLLVITFSYVPLIADTGSSHSSQTQLENKEKQRTTWYTMLKKRTQSKLVPSRLFIEGEVTENGITFVTSELLDSFFVVVINDDTHEEWSGFITEEENSIPFDGEIGSYTICITTPDRGPLYGGFEL